MQLYHTRAGVATDYREYFKGDRTGDRTGDRFFDEFMEKPNLYNYFYLMISFTNDGKRDVQSAARNYINTRVANDNSLNQKAQGQRGGVENVSKDEGNGSDSEAQTVPSSEAESSDEGNS